MISEEYIEEKIFKKARGKESETNFQLYMLDLSEFLMYMYVACLSLYFSLLPLVSSTKTPLEGEAD
jgi:hypothetical protein